jgi:hypothetical protein
LAGNVNMCHLILIFFGKELDEIGDWREKDNFAYPMPQLVLLALLRLKGNEHFLMFNINCLPVGLILEQEKVMLFRFDVFFYFFVEELFDRYSYPKSKNRLEHFFNHRQCTALSTVFKIALCIFY